VPSHVRRAAIASLSALGAVAACARPAPRAHTVTIRNFAFDPAELTVARGDTVVWSNTDFVPHSSTSRNSAWGSNAIGANATWRFVASATGRYEYYCVFHPTMKATIFVR
jgi:plastocyanin